MTQISMSLNDACIYHQAGQSGRLKALADAAFLRLYDTFLDLSGRLAPQSLFRGRMNDCDWEDVRDSLLLWENKRLENLRQQLLSGDVVFANDNKATAYLRSMLSLTAQDYLRKRDRHPETSIDEQADLPTQTLCTVDAPKMDLASVKTLLDELVGMAVDDAKRCDRKRNILDDMDLAWKLKLQQITIKGAMTQEGCGRDAIYKRCDRIRKTLRRTLGRRASVFGDDEREKLHLTIDALVRRNHLRKKAA